MVPADQLHCLLFGGDQLTRKRVETTIELCSTPIHALKGTQPVCEDWHAKKCLLEITCIMYISDFIFLGDLEEVL